MKKFFFLTIFVFAFLFFSTGNIKAGEIDKLIRESNFDLRSTVSILAQDAKTENILYKKNEKKLLNPASTLKVLTFGASYLELGPDYEFETALYKDGANNLYVKLSGDVLLSQNDLNKLFATLKTKIDVSKIKNIYIDDTIIDKMPYPLGWMEDDIWPKSRAITPYIVDKNFVQIAIKRSSLATKVDIIQNDPYKMAIINELKIGPVQDFKISRMFGETSPIIAFSGTVSKDELINLPVLSPEINFNIKLRKAIEKNEIIYLNKIISRKTPKDAVKLAFVSHDIKQISKNILHNSDNFAAEVVFKVAAAKYVNYNHPARLEDAISMLQNYFPFEEGIVVSDGSGVSRYNLLSCEFMNNALLKLFKSGDFKELLPTANEGTLKDRVLFLENNLRAKTGTLSKISSVAGILKTKKGNEIVFCSIIQNSPKRAAVLKNFEDVMMSELYRRY